MDRTLAKLTNEYFRLRIASKGVGSPYLYAQIKKVETKIKHHLHVNYQFENHKQQNLDL